MPVDVHRRHLGVKDGDPTWIASSIEFGWDAGSSAASVEPMRGSRFLRAGFRIT
jgi:hypothetical protein